MKRNAFSSWRRISIGFSKSRGIPASLSPRVAMIQHVARERSVAFYQAMDCAQVALRVALAAHRFVFLGGVAMRFDVGGIAFERAQKTSQRILMLVLLAIEQAEFQVHVGAGGHDCGRAEQMTQRAAEIALAFEQRGEAHVRFEVAGLTSDQFAVDCERLERILVGDAPRLLEALTHACRPEAILDLAALIAAAEVENQLSRLSLDQRRTVAHDDTAFVIDQFQRGDRTIGIDQRAHALEASLDRIDMLARAEQLLGHAHLEQIVEGETILAAAGIQRTHKIALDPVTNTLGS